METTEQILSRQYTKFKFRNGQVEYFSISTQHDKAKTVEEAINNIFDADKKYEGKAPINFSLNKCNSIYQINNGDVFTKEQFDMLLEIAKNYTKMISGELNENFRND